MEIGFHDVILLLRLIIGLWMEDCAESMLDVHEIAKQRSEL